MKIGEWLSADICEYYVYDEDLCDECNEKGICGKKATHVIFLNVPDSNPYVVGACDHHADSDDFPSMKIAEFKEKLAKLKETGDKLPWAVAEKIDPGLKTVKAGK